MMISFICILDYNLLINFLENYSNITFNIIKLFVIITIYKYKFLVTENGDSFI